MQIICKFFYNFYTLLEYYHPFFMYIVNLSQDKNFSSPYLSTTLVSHIDKILLRWEKILLYINKRWEYNSLICESCQHIHKCPNCDVSLSVHSKPDRLICHVCDTTYPLYNSCESCGQTTLKKVWVGTQQIESTLRGLYPNKNICRFDTDMIKNKSEKLAAFTLLQTADIIIGTKMVTTGFNIPNLGLIGVILLEQELQIPAYNTHEQVYSNITQLLGRWWRVDQKTEVVIQTFVPNNPMIQTITQKNYKDFFFTTLSERKLFHYPPFCEMVTLHYRHADKEKAKIFLEKIHSKLSATLTDWETHISISRIWNGIKKQNQYFYSCIIKGHGLHDFLQTIKSDIYRNSGLQVVWSQ